MPNAGSLHHLLGTTSAIQGSAGLFPSNFGQQEGTLSCYNGILVNRPATRYSLAVRVRERIIPRY